MSSSSLLTKHSHLVRRVVVSALIAATLVCGVVVGEGSAFARGGGGRVGVSHGRIGGFGRPIAPYRYGAPGYRYAPGYPGWRAAPGYWGVRPGWVGRAAEVTLGAADTLGVAAVTSALAAGVTLAAATGVTVGSDRALLGVRSSGRRGRDACKRGAVGPDLAVSACP